MAGFQAAAEQVEQFARDGFLVARGLFDPDEIALLGHVARADQALAAQARDKKDAAGVGTRLALRNDLGDDLYSTIVRCRRLADTMEALLGDEVYHYHHKMNMKEPYVGGAWEWHQDYGYWYHNGCLYPDMGSVMIAVDAATRENGCLQVIRGSHRLGRIDHGQAGEQTGADLERVEQALARLELVHCEMEPGDAVFFHANTLHRSDQNRSPNPRWTLICCYNTRHNDPYRESHHPGYQPLARVDDAAVRTAGERQWATMQAAAR